MQLNEKLLKGYKYYLNLEKIKSIQAKIYNTNLLYPQKNIPSQLFAR